MTKNVTILGAGITGVSLGSYLSDKKYDVSIIEKTQSVGGMAKSFKYKKNILDFGPHKIYSQIPHIIEEFHKIAKPKKLLRVKKRNSLFLLGKMFDFPVQIFQIVLSINPFKSLSLGIGFAWTTFKNFFSRAKPKTYEQYFIKGFGKPAYKLIFKGTAEKVWGPPTRLSEELGRKRVPVPNVLEMLGSGKGKDSQGRELSAKYFFYPEEGGIGFVSEQFKKNIQKNKGKINTDSTIAQIKTKKNKVESVIYKKNGRKITQKTDFLASTIYLTDLLSTMSPKPPKYVMEAANNLKYRGLILVYLIVNKPKVMKDNWVFFPEREYIFSRVSEHNSFSPNMVEEGKAILTAEIPADPNGLLFNSDPEYHYRRVIEDLEKTGIVQEKDIEEFVVRKAKRVYPVYDTRYRRNLKVVLSYLDSFDNLITLGRQGLYNYNNTDHCIDMSKKATFHIDRYFKVSSVKIEEWRKMRRYFNSYRIVD